MTTTIKGQKGITDYARIEIPDNLNTHHIKMFAWDDDSLHTLIAICSSDDNIHLETDCEYETKMVSFKADLTDLPEFLEHMQINGFITTNVQNRILQQLNKPEQASHQAYSSRLNYSPKTDEGNSASTNNTLPSK